MTAVADSYAALDARITALEQHLGSDNLQPNVLTVNPDGSIGADFTGHVHAQGLDLDASVLATAPKEDRIRWLRSDGTVAAALAGFDTPAIDSLAARAYRRDLANGVHAFLSAVDTDQVTQLAGVDAKHDGGLSSVTAAADNHSVTLIDGNAASTFLRLTAAALLAIDVGTTDVTWDGTGPLATVTGIPHSLFRTPQILLATMHAAGQGVVIACHAGNQNPSWFDLQAEWIGFTPAAGTVIPAMWAAIG